MNYFDKESKSDFFFGGRRFFLLIDKETKSDFFGGGRWGKWGG